MSFGSDTFILSSSTPYLVGRQGRLPHIDKIHRKCSDGSSGGEARKALHAAQSPPRVLAEPTIKSRISNILSDLSCD